MHEIQYLGGSEPGLSYRGRNGYAKQAGIAVHDCSREGRQVLRLCPITSRGALSDACHLEVPADAVPALVSVLRALTIDPETEENEQTPR